MGYVHVMPEHHVGRLVIDIMTDDDSEIDFGDKRIYTAEDLKKIADYAAKLVLTKEDSKVKMHAIGVEMHNHDTDSGRCDHCSLNLDETWNNLP